MFGNIRLNQHWISESQIREVTRQTYFMNQSILQAHSTRATGAAAESIERSCAVDPTRQINLLVSGFNGVGKYLFW